MFNRENLKETTGLINNLVEKAFLALVSWFLFSMVQDIKSLNSSVQQLNEKMAVAISDITNQKDAIKRLEADIDWLDKHTVQKK